MNVTNAELWVSLSLMHTFLLHILSIIQEFSGICRSPGRQRGDVPFPRAGWQRPAWLPLLFSVCPPPRPAPLRPFSPESQWWSSWSETCPLWWCTGQYQPLQRTQNPSCIFHGFHSLTLKADTIGEIKPEIVKSEEGWTPPIVLLQEKTNNPPAKHQVSLQKTHQRCRYSPLSNTALSYFCHPWLRLSVISMLISWRHQQCSSTCRLSGKHVCEGGCEWKEGATERLLSLFPTE